MSPATRLAARDPESDPKFAGIYSVETHQGWRFGHFAPAIASALRTWR
jgi:hypothetical protein